MKIPSEIISFRADEELLRQIDAACVECQLSRGTWAKEVVIHRLHERRAAVTQDDLSKVTDQIEKLQADIDDVRDRWLAKLLFQMLMHVGNVPRDQAKELVRTKFLDKDG